MSGDPFVKNPGNGQNYNRYAYVLNNPLRFVDPSGYFDDAPGGGTYTGFNDSYNLSGGSGSGITIGGVTIGINVGSSSFSSGKNVGNSSSSSAGGTTSAGGSIASILKSAANSGVRNLTAGDIIQSHLAGAGNAAANMVVGFGNLMMAIGDVTGNAEPFAPAQPFTPTSKSFGAQGAAIFDGLSMVTGGTGVGKGILGFMEKAGGEGPRILYHYTNEAGMKGVLESEKLYPSLKSVNPKDARYGNGQYLSSIPPGTMTNSQLSRAFVGMPFQGSRFTHYLGIDVRGLNVIEGRTGVFVVPNESDLNLTGRIFSSGKNVP